MDKSFDIGFVFSESVRLFKQHWIILLVLKSIHLFLFGYGYIFNEILGLDVPQFQYSFLVIPYALSFLITLASVRLSILVVNNKKVSFGDLWVGWSVFFNYLILGALFLATILVPVMLVGSILIVSLGFHIFNEGFSELFSSLPSELWIGLVALAIGLALIAWFVSIRLRYVLYVLIDENVGPLVAIEKSWKVTSGYFSKLVSFSFVLGLLNVVGTMGAGIGIVLTSSIALMADAVVYQRLRGNYSEDLSDPDLGDELAELAR